MLYSKAKTFKMICFSKSRSTKHTTVIDSIFTLAFYFESHQKMWILSSSWVAHFGGSSSKWGRQWQVKLVKGRQGNLAISSRSFCFVTSLAYVYTLYKPVSLPIFVSFKGLSLASEAFLWGKEPSSREVSKSGSPPVAQESGSGDWALEEVEASHSLTQSLQVPSFWRLHFHWAVSHSAKWSYSPRVFQLTAANVPLHHLWPLRTLSIFYYYLSAVSEHHIQYDYWLPNMLITDQLFRPECNDYQLS